MVNKIKIEWKIVRDFRLKLMNNLIIISQTIFKNSNNLCLKIHNRILRRIFRYLIQHK